MNSYDAKGYYQELGVSPQAGENEIKLQYRRLAKEWHPDYNKSPEALDKFQKISVAYEVLTDEQRRLTYDLLSYAYAGRKFPDMDNLEVYTSRRKYKETDLQILDLYKITSKLVSHSEQHLHEICDYDEAKKLASSVCIHNWLFGWWSLSGLAENIKALLHNYRNFRGSNADNFNLLTHNMVAYAQENQPEKAYGSGILAARYADDYGKSLINRFLQKITLSQQPYVAPLWNYAPIKYIQLLPPVVVVLALLLLQAPQVMSSAEFNRWFSRDNSISYYQEVRFNSGAKTVDDLAVSKVVSIPVDTDDMSKLYHVSSDVKVMYGPDEDFDVMANLPVGTTVRLTGYTPDEKWGRIMLDNGEMGFVYRNKLKTGIGRDIPDDSKIYTGLR